MIHVTHQAECYANETFTIDRHGLCICDRLRAAYRRGFNDHARAQQHWQDTHGAYRAAPIRETDPLPESPAGPWPALGGTS